jgi:hypothetical protein
MPVSIITPGEYEFGQLGIEVYYLIDNRSQKIEPVELEKRLVMGIHVLRNNPDELRDFSRRVYGFLDMPERLSNINTWLSRIRPQMEDRVESLRPTIEQLPDWEATRANFVQDYQDAGSNRWLIGCMASLLAFGGIGFHLGDGMGLACGLGVGMVTAFLNKNPLRRYYGRLNLEQEERAKILFNSEMTRYLNDRKCLLPNNPAQPIPLS